MRQLNAPRGVVAFLALALIPVFGGWSAGAQDNGPAQAIVDSGHRGAVLAIDHDDARSLIFTAGADGTVRIWDAATRHLIKSLTVTSLEAGMLSVSPDSTRFAVLATDFLQTFSLEVWDWQKGERLFRIALEDQPLFLRYSGSGKYLLYGLPRWDSLRIANASDGSHVAFHPEGFGIVGFATLSRSERILMTYRMTGEITYWDLASGKVLESLQSVPLLSHLRLFPDLGSMAGSTGTGLYVVNVASGAVKASASLAGVTSLDVSPKGDEIACIAEEGALSRWDVQPGALARKADQQGAPPRGSAARYAAGALIVGSRGGQLISFAADGTGQDFPGDQRAEITGMAVRGDTVALATSSWIKVFTAGLAGAVRPDAGADEVQSLQVDNPLQAPAVLAFLDDDSLLACRSSGGQGACVVLDIRNRTFHSPGDPLAAPVIEAAADAGRCVLLAEDGTLRVLGFPGGPTRSEMRRPGALWAAPARGDAIVVGGAPGDVQLGSLVKIALSTEETDPIPTRNLSTYSVVYDSATDTLYSLGVDSDGTTNLIAHSGPGYQTQALIDSSPGEHLSASICFDSATGSLFSSLGRERISRWSKGSLQKLPASARGTLALFSASGMLYSLNRDSSVTFIDPQAGAKMAELSVFKDGGWALLLPDGKFAASAGSESRVSVLRDGLPVHDVASYLVPIRVAADR